MSDTVKEFQERVFEGLQDVYRKKVSKEAQDFLRSFREPTLEEMGNYEEWSKRAEEIKTHTIENLDAYLEQFASKVRENGGDIYFAESKESANQYITDLAKKRSVKVIAKSKSMVTEELELNKELEEIGIDVYETDLGEFIVQLADERPSHLIGPAAHKSKEQVAEIFSKLAGEKIPADPQTLAAFARGYLREKFFQADMGISGCNFGVAETGSVVLVSNEGNARICTTLPKIHVVVMGMERLVPSWEDLDILISLLPKSAIGKRTISYITSINSPKQLDDLDGPEELHMIVVDNGRSEMLGTKYQLALNCIRCGNCSNVCPVYRHIGGHAYGGVYSGPIGSVITPLMEGMEEWNELPYACSVCGACTEGCPVRIPLHEYHVSLRADYVEQFNPSWKEKMAHYLFGVSSSHPSLYKMGQKIAPLGFKKEDSDSELTSSGLGPLKMWVQTRDIPIPKNTFRDWWKNERKGE